MSEQIPQDSANQPREADESAVSRPDAQGTDNRQAPPAQDSAGLTAQPQQAKASSAPADNSWEYQALQHGWVPPTQEGRQGTPQPGAWQQPAQPWSTQSQQSVQNGQQQQAQPRQPQQPWQQQSQQSWGGQQQPRQNGWGQQQGGPQPNGQNAWMQVPQDDGKFTTSRKVLWLAAGCLTGIFSLILVLIVGMGRSPQYRRQAVQWSCLGIVAAVFIDLALFAYIGVTPDLVTGITSGSSAGSTSGSSGSAF